jgi:hypothetical protein
MIKFKNFLIETGLSTTELSKTFATTGELRVTALADKIWGGKPLQLTTGKKKKIKVISYGTEDNVWEYYANVPVDKKKFLNAFKKSVAEEDWKKKYKLVIEKPTMKLRDLEKTEDFGGKAGTGPTGAEWESLITHQLNKEIGNENADEDAKKIASKHYPTYEKSAKAIAKNFIKEFGKGKMVQYGAKASKANLSQLWKDHGGKNGTPKTDMYTKKYNISLKKSGGSQLASGTKEETISTFYAALKYLGEDKSSKPDIAELMTKIEKGFKKVALDYTKGDLDKLAAGEKVKGKKKSGLTGKDAKEFKKFTQTEKFHKKFNKELDAVLKLGENKKFVEWYCFEAMSGLKKFNAGARQSVASVCVTFDPAKWTISKINVTDSGEASGLSGGTPSVSSDLKAKAKKTKIYSAFKSSGGKPYSTLRLSGDNYIKDEETLVGCTLNSIIRDEILLDEDVKSLGLNLTEEIVALDEFALIKSLYGKLKNVGKDVQKWVGNLFKRIFEKVSQAMEKIKKLGKELFEGLFQFLGIQITKVQTTLPSELSDFVNK